MSYQLPDQETLIRYLAMLREVLVDARFRAYERDPQIAELLDAVENVPDLLARFPEMDTAMVEGQLEDYERRYLNGNPKYSSTLRDGPRPGWQLRWGAASDPPKSK
jgi:hypothetical protein